MQLAPKHVLVLLVLFGLATRLPQAFKPIGYDHDWNTGHYCGEAYNFLSYGMAEQRPPEWDHPDYQHTQLVPWVIFTASLAFGFGSFAGRLLMTVFMVSTATLVYLIAVECGWHKQAPVACLIYLTMPISLKFSYHVQLDPPMTFFLALGLLFLIRYEKSRRGGDLCLAGAAFSVATLAKMSAAVVCVMLIGLAMIRFRERDRRASLQLGLTGVLVPVPFLIWILATSATTSVNVLSELLEYSVSGGGKLSLSGLPMLAVKTVDMYGILLVPAALGVLRAFRGDQTRVLAAYVATQIGFLALFNKHNYYLIPVSIVVSLSVAFVLDQRVRPRWRTPLLIGLVVISLSHFAAQFLLYRLDSPDFRIASELNLATPNVWVDSPQMGYYLTRNGVGYAPFDRSSPRAGDYLLIDDHNVEWLLDNAPSATMEIIDGEDAFSRLRSWLRRLVGEESLANLQLRRVVVTA